MHELVTSYCSIAPDKHGSLVAVSIECMFIYTFDCLIQQVVVCWPRVAWLAWCNWSVWWSWSWPTAQGLQLMSVCTSRRTCLTAWSLSRRAIRLSWSSAFCFNGFVHLMFCSALWVIKFLSLWCVVFDVISEQYPSVMTSSAIKFRHQFCTWWNHSCLLSL